MACWRDKKRKHWCYRFQVNKVNYNGRGYKTKAEARRALVSHRDQIKKGSIPVHSIDMVFSQAANSYLDECLKRFVKKTYEYKVFVLRSFLNKNNDLPIVNITPYHISEYLKTRPSNYNYNFHRKELLVFFNFVIDRFKIISVNPVSSVPRLPHSSKKKVIPNDSDIQKLLSVASPDEKVFLLVILNLGGRIGEILRLRWEDVNFKSGSITRYTRKRKGGELQSIITPMNLNLRNIFDFLWQNRISDEWVFYNSSTGSHYKDRRKMLYSLCDRAGVPRIHFHEFRHYFASVLASTPGISRKSIGDLLGHLHLGTTEIYLHSVESSLQSVVDSLDDKFSFDYSSGEKKDETAAKTAAKNKKAPTE